MYNPNAKLVPQKRIYNLIIHTARINAEIAVSGTVSGGSMVACCIHFALNVAPILGFSGLAAFLMVYQKWFFGLGILSNVIGITVLVKHRRTMRNQRFLKHSNSIRSLNEMKGGAC